MPHYGCGPGGRVGWGCGPDGGYGFTGSFSPVGKSQEGPQFTKAETGQFEDAESESGGKGSLLLFAGVGAAVALAFTLFGKSRE